MAGYPMPHGYRDGNIALLVMAIFGEFVQGGLVFGWNALAIMLQEQGFYTKNCGVSGDVVRDNGTFLCKYQENHLSVLWTVGIFALNFGPVFVGPVLDYFGPKLTVILGTLLNMLGLILIGCSRPGKVNALIPGAVILGLGGITYHLGNFHISNLFPRKRGLISSLFVAGFTGCGIIFYILNEIYKDLGGSWKDYRGTLIVYAFVCALWLPLNLWMMPWNALAIGDTYVFTKSWRFRAVNRRSLQEEMHDGHNLGEVALTDQAKPDHATNGLANGHTNGGSGMPVSHGPSPSTLPKCLTSGHQPAQKRFTLPCLAAHGEHEDAFADMGLGSSSDPRWMAGGGEASPTRRKGRPPGEESPAVSPHSMTEIDIQDSPRGHHAGMLKGEPERLGPARRTDLEAGQRARAPSKDVVWGPLVFEARRFVELRKKSFWDQFMSAESFGMGVFYTANVFCIQFYLGTTRLQLEHKGDSQHHYTNFANIIVSFGFVGIPLIGWLLDKKGYGITLGTINFFGVLCSVLQAIPSLQLQAFTLIIWAAGRFFLYSSYFAIFGALFGFKNFGRMVAIDNTFNGLIGILQLPLAWWGVGGLHGNFTLINCLQIVVLMPLFLFCYAMYKWERQDLVPIRPMEGEELPLDITGPRAERQLKFVETLKHTIHIEAPPEEAL